MQCLLWGRPPQAAVTLRGGTGGPPEDIVTSPVQSSGPAASGGGGNLQLPALPSQVGGIRPWSLHGGLWNKCDLPECNACAGVRWPGGASNCRALLRGREVAYSQALCQDAMSSSLESAEHHVSRGRGPLATGQC